MWVGRVPLRALGHPARWTVEALCADARARAETRARPDGAWARVRLGEVMAERAEALDPQAFPDHRFHYVGLENVCSHTGDLADLRPVRGREVRSRSKVFRRGDVLYGRLRPELNKVFLAEGSVSEGICSGEFHVLVPDPARVSGLFLRAVLASEYVQDRVRGRTSGATRPRLHLDDLAAIEVPLCPLAVQREFDAFLLAQDARRRALATELAALPAATHAAFVRALDAGGLPDAPPMSPQLPSPGDVPPGAPCPLPAGDFRVRRRPPSA